MATPLAAEDLPVVAEPPQAKPRRAVALDALRGAAILMMVFSGVVPYLTDQTLPPWLYHAQEPPPSHEFDPTHAGLTFVDLVFPFFLFSMGAAIPLALASRLDKGLPLWQAALGAVQRLVLLGWFAIYFEHIRPTVLASHPTPLVYGEGLLGFALFFPMLTRLPDKWPRWAYWATRTLGYGAAIGLLAYLSQQGYPDKTGFRLNRSDIIIVVLADMALFGSVIWLLTRQNLLARLAVLPLYIAIRLAGPGSHGWVHTVWTYSPVPWLYACDYLKYLCLVIPGTIAGDLLLGWGKDSPPAPNNGGARAEGLSNPAPPLLGAGRLFFPSLALILVTLCGLQTRQLWSTTVIDFGLCALASALTARAADPTAHLLKGFVRWGSYLLVLGLLLEPFEGGIKKDHPTLSYLFVTGGLSFFALTALTLIADVWRKPRFLALLTENGQNPMIAYVAMNTVIQPLLALTGFGETLAIWLPTPWLGVLRGGLETFALALIVMICTRAKLFWRT